MLSAAVFSPAKINLFLAVTGRRADGFHDLVSLVAPLRWGDRLWVRRMGVSGGIGLTCNDPAVPTGDDNLIVRAAAAYRLAAGIDEALEMDLTKTIPMGAGLGGGSSNAAATLRAMDVLFAHVLPKETLFEIAARIGSDCPLFLHHEPCIMRGRGELIERLSPVTRAGLSGRRVLVFKPDFGIGTPWAYARLAAARGNAYLHAAEAEARLSDWRAGETDLAATLFNSFEAVAFRKFRALPAIVEALRLRTGVEGVLMSGSGSACVALLHEAADAAALIGLVRACLGESAFVVETRIG